MDRSTREVLAKSLEKAEREGAPIAPLTRSYPEMTAADAYEVQLINIRRRIADGASVAGHKVGLSSRAMQRMMGVDEPDYGHLLADMFIPSGSVVSADRYCYPRVEIEVGFQLRSALSGPDCTAEDVVAATDHVMPAIELIDSRIADWKITIADTIADNASSAGVVLGPAHVALDEIAELPLLGAALWKNGEMIESGVAGAVLGNPITAVAWLANKLHAFGVRLEPGHVVLPGSCTRAVDVHPGDVVRAEFAQLGEVEVTFA
ncbi:MAG: 2-keto-4-pentenoate hydratase [Acidimicrobiales bacterium]|nr:2-keto-4-pentenoate hydratase [Acidimicrobiales bacterium]